MLRTWERKLGTMNTQTPWIKFRGSTTRPVNKSRQVEYLAGQTGTAINTCVLLALLLAIYFNSNAYTTDYTVNIIRQSGEQIKY